MVQKKQYKRNEIVLQFVGNGFMWGIPARDLTADDLKKLPLSKDELIKSGLYKEAVQKDPEYIKEEVDPDTNEDITIKYKVRKYKVAPNIKAIQVLANKYNIDFAEKDRTKEFNVNILNVDSDRMSLRELQELSNPLQELEADYKVLKSNDSKDLEARGFELVDDSEDLEDSEGCVL